MTARDPLNFISPYERLPAGHENQLTRVLLLLLRLSPLAHIEWLRLVDPNRRLAALPTPTFATSYPRRTPSGRQRAAHELQGRGRPRPFRPCETAWRP